MHVTNLPIYLRVCLLFALTWVGHGQAQDLGLPPVKLPIEVDTHFRILNIHDINDEDEIIQFSGILTLEWLDPRQAFTPDEHTGPEKVYSGNYQFNELSPAWYPQVLLINATENSESGAVLLRIAPDGSCQLAQQVTSSVKTDLNMKAYPFDDQKAELIFEILGFTTDEAKLICSDQTVSMDSMMVPVPQWTIHGAQAEALESTNSTANDAPSSALRIMLDIERKPLFAIRLVVIPLILIVILSWSVFWMERSSLGDRMAVSFVGILTAVSYQVMIGDTLPSIAYFTLMNAFLLFSFIQMCTTVLLNLIVSAYDKRGEYARGNAIDYHCRWIFPTSYVITLVGIYLYFTPLR